MKEFTALLGISLQESWPKTKVYNSKFTNSSIWPKTKFTTPKFTTQSLQLFKILRFGQKQSLQHQSLTPANKSLQIGQQSLTPASVLVSTIAHSVFEN